MGSFDALASQILLPAFFIFALVWALAGALIGAGLIASRDTTLRFFAWVNSWVSARSRLKWAEVPRDIDRAMLAYRAWFAALIIAGGLFTLFLLIERFDVERMAARSELIRSWLLQSVKAILVAGSLLAIVVGVLLAFFPRAMHALETVANRWVSTRQATRQMSEGGDRMHLVLDRCVAAHPRVSGWIIVALSLACIFATGSTLLAR